MKRGILYAIAYAIAWVIAGLAVLWYVHEANAQRATPWGAYETMVRQAFQDHEVAYPALVRTVAAMPTDAQERFVRKLITELGLVTEPQVDIGALPDFDPRLMKRLEQVLTNPESFGNGAELYALIEANAVPPARE